jgi:hypothetical protein
MRFFLFVNISLNLYSDIYLNLFLYKKKKKSDNIVSFSKAMYRAQEIVRGPWVIAGPLLFAID